MDDYIKKIPEDPDVVKIVRCKDCARAEIYKGARYCNFGNCIARLVEADFFCKDGIRQVPRLIDANAAFASMREKIKDRQEESERANDEESKAWFLAQIEALYIAMEAITDVPTKEAAPRQHGIWKREDADFICSVCGADAPIGIHAVQQRSRYCPNCGARMDARMEENQ